MGLFDDVRCRYPLPNPAHQDLAFQSKSLNASGDSYVITEDGRLLLVGYMFGKPEAPIEVEDVHQDVLFYTSVYHDRQPEGTHRWIRGGKHLAIHRDGSITEIAPPEWIEYRARFTNGRVAWIRREADTLG